LTSGQRIGLTSQGSAQDSRLDCEGGHCGDDIHRWEARLADGLWNGGDRGSQEMGDVGKREEDGVDEMLTDVLCFSIASQVAVQSILPLDRFETPPLADKLKLAGEHWRGMDFEMVVGVEFCGS